MSNETVGAVGFGNWSIETNGHPIDGFNYHTRHTMRLTPTLAASVQVPASDHSHVRVEHDVIVPRDLEVLAVRIDRLDRPTQSRGRTGQPWRFEPHHLLADEGRPQCGCGSVNRVSLWHEKMLDATNTPARHLVDTLAS